MDTINPDKYYDHIIKTFGKMNAVQQRIVLEQLSNDYPDMHQNAIQQVCDELNDIDNKKEYDDEEAIPIFDCVGCGYCCKHVQCAISIRQYGYRTMCPALIWEEKLYRCKFAEKYGKQLGIGKGCVAPSYNEYRAAMIAGNGKEFPIDFYPP